MMKKVIVFGVDGLTMPLLRRFVDEGILPNIAAMFKAGASTELLPFISAWGDVNWVSFLSGQCPGTAWIGQTMPPDNHKTHNLLSLLEKAGRRTALVHFPESVSGKAPHFEFAPFWGRSEASPYELCSSAIHTTRYDERTTNKQGKKQKLGWPPTSALAYHNKGSWRPIVTTEGEYRLKLEGSGAVLTLTARPDADGLALKVDKETVVLRIGQWSQWVPLRLGDKSGMGRFWLAQYDRELGDVEIIQSQVMHLEGLSNDPALEKDLINQLGPFISKWTAKVAPTEDYRTSAYQEGEYQSFWLADSAVKLTRDYNISLWATVHRLVDESHHNCLGQYDPASPFYNSEQADIYGDVMRECYRILDRTMGRIMAGMDDDTTLLLASDHGAVPNSYMCDIYRYLEKWGLVELRSNGSVILEKSKVFLKDERGGLEIYVNLEGRDSTGIVSRQYYEPVRDLVLHALGNWHVKENGTIRNAVAVALKKEDAMGIGYWGPHAGDIIFAYDTGFVWGVSAGGEDICSIEIPGANHGPQKPTAETNVSSNYGVLLAYGSGIRCGYYHDKTVQGSYRMVDPAATIAHLLGLKHASLDGVVMNDLLIEDEVVR
ncbi:MAG: putative type phosphodiesterase/nucleotide pyrophosphatase [Anaerosporomusa subterranea]|jgi:hypothetical protein|nr:putative type phosphodiesterase/nucleotide pyrophosphatase [Anaerosporomusa subterranea]